MAAELALWDRTSGPRDARIFILAESEGVEERDAGSPLVGPSGQLLNALLAEAGIVRDACFCTNVVRERPPGNEMQAFFLPKAEAGKATEVGGLLPGPKVRAGLNALYEQLEQVQPALVLALGNYALWALTGHAGNAADGPRARIPTGILDWRGSQCFRLKHGLSARIEDPRRLPVLPLAHPAAILRDWSLRAPTEHDLRTRVPLALSGLWAREARSPTYDLRAGLSFPEVEQTLLAWLGTQEPLWLACDIETWKSHLITCIGFATSPTQALSIPFVKLAAEKGRIESFWPPAQEARLLRLLGRLFHSPNLRWIGQNFVYDQAFIWEWFRCEVKLAWDTKDGQHLLFPGTQKDLGYLSSLYCAQHKFWKTDARDWTEDAAGLGLEQLLLYNAEDCARTFEMAEGQQSALLGLE